MGFWYIGLCIAFGVIGLVSGNNVIYLLDSLLLAGMIFSGILSEREVSRARVEVIRGPACAGSPTRDRVRVQNLGNAPLCCLEIGEWVRGRFVPIAYIRRLGPRERVVIPSGQVIGSRGVHRWDGLAISTGFPFGLARKIRIESEPGERVVWPRRLHSGEEAGEPGRGSCSALMTPRVGGEITEGEVRPMTPDDDCRSIVWTLSARGGEPLVRPRHSGSGEVEVTLDLRGEAGDPFEAAVARAAEPFHLQGRFGDRSTGGTLTLIDHRGRRKIHGRERALDLLARAQPAGRAG